MKSCPGLSEESWTVIVHLYNSALYPTKETNKLLIEQGVDSQEMYELDF